MKKISDYLIPFENFVRTADMIVETFGENCEVVIHDFRDVSNSIVYIKGNVTNRELGAPATTLLLKDLYKYKDDIKDKFSFSARTSDGRLLKTSISFLRDESGAVIGCMGINLDVTDLIMANKLINSITKTKGIEVISQIETEEYYPKNIEEVFEKIVDETYSQFTMAGPDMKREDKLRFVEMLDEKGAFMINGAIEKISELLNVSKQSVYNYLDEIRNTKEKRDS
ncbi:transcriptional regulator [Priestia megaterium]|uniref:helix-turn-helix transcriptional regulator n=1 Tax=Priestia megaterium TaxID=1404 RepID=UPI00366E7D9C